VAATRLISIVGKKDAGKTTLVVALAAELARQNKLRVMTVKHGTHTADVDQRGKDTWRHYHEGKAERVVMEAPGQRVIWERRERESDPVSLARRYLDGADIVLVEGFSAHPLPKIETYRLACGQDPLYDPTRPDAGLWVAMITDNSSYRASFPVFRFTDTAWLATLSHIAWDRAKILDP
jgi:molybdopterin-guanine dinucleotide biosynthesis protein MobB